VVTDGTPGRPSLIRSIAHRLAGEGVSPYQLVRQPGPIVERHIEGEFLAAGVEAHCCTFG
jgi:hypothetical protein